MAASRSSTPALNIRSPHPKSTLTIEDWEAKAPLGDTEVKSVASIKAAIERRPVLQQSTIRVKKKFKYLSEAGPASRPSTPLQRIKLNLGSRPDTPVSRPPAAAHAHALHPKLPVQTPQQFYDWFALIDRSVAHSQEAHFRQHLLRVTEHLNMCDRLVGRIDQVDAEVAGMLDGWTSVEEGGKSLQDASQKLLDERDRLVDLQGAIGTTLEYFQELEHATRLLNHPGESLVLQTDFLYMVERVDICIEFLKSHRNYKEAELYLLRFQQCMTRAMTLIKMYFVGSLRALTQDVSRRLFDQDVSDTAQVHLLYTRFITVAGQVSPLLGELENRARAHPDELGALLSECHAAYFGARKNLLVSRLTEQIRGLDPTRTELVELTRAGCSYLKQICTEEFDLYRAFFNSGKDKLYQYLETLCDYLYDDLRPRILHEPRLTVLCEVCTVLQALIVLDQPLGDEVDEDEEKNDELGRLHIRRLLQMVLQDAQTRLFFKAQAVIQSEIRYYTPTAQDLAYPDKLIAAQGASTGYEIREKQSISRLFEGVGLHQRETWFPTLVKTVWVLSQLHDFVQPAIFNDLAQEAVSLCRVSLLSAADSLGAKSAFDGQLFLVRHLLILRDIARNLDLAQKDEPRGGVTADAYGVAGECGLASRLVPDVQMMKQLTQLLLARHPDTLSSVLSRTSTLLPGSLFTSLAGTRVEHLADAKRGIDQDLKRACETVISTASEPLCSPLRAFTGRPASAAEAAVLDEAFRSACARDFRASLTRIRLYVSDGRTSGVLVQHARGRVDDAYTAFRLAARQVAARVGVENGLMDDERLGKLLQEVCEGDEVDVAGSPGQA
ncbi:Sec34-like family-domain-containing protein [Multifurca ochricompacta]|uniref:Conserved oligomeric Golgi complex subunit 3 n=1 Tax=Multifurca ochricompacta TaxID=376703 RepID=A0AAD4LW23_9AGAM|nr:Sec34-like family-domain-containing protein [Multifurca ochricompacta]